MRAALLALALLAAGPAFALPTPSQFGVTSADAYTAGNLSLTPNQVAALFGAYWIRIRVPFAPNATMLNYVTAASSAGYAVQVNVPANCGITSDATYRTNLTTLLGQIQTAGATSPLVVVGNEENSDNSKGTGTITSNVLNLTTYPAGVRLPQVGNGVAGDNNDVTLGTTITSINHAWDGASGAYGVTTTPDVAVAEGMSIGCTAPQYITDLHSGIATGHALGMKVTDSGSTFHGEAFAYYYALLNCTGLGTGQCTPTPASDRYWSAAFRWEDTAGGMPNSCYPTRAFLGRATDAPQLLTFQKTQAILADAATNGQDYLNAHWYRYPPPLTVQTLTWWHNQAPNIPLMVNEFGEYSSSGADINNMLTEMVTINVNPMIAFVPDGAINAVGLVNADGTLRASGYAYQTFIASGSSPHAPPIRGDIVTIPPLVAPNC